MHSKNLFSPDKTSPAKSQFKPLFLPLFAYYLALTVTVAFVCEIFAPILSSYSKTFLVPILYITFLLAYPTLIAYWTVKKLDIILSDEGIAGNTFWGCRIYKAWPEIILVKRRWIFGSKWLCLKTSQGQSIYFSPFSYEALQMLESVKYYAGEDHLLVRALEKETSAARQRPLKLWWQVIGAIGVIISTWLIGGNLWAAQQEKPLNAAIANYQQRHPQTPPNKSAIELQALMTKLGLSLETFYDGSKAQAKPSEATVAEFKGITNPSVLIEFIDKKLNNAEDIVFLTSPQPSETLPPKLASYLKNHETDLQAIEDHLINNSLPEWGINSLAFHKNITGQLDTELASKKPLFNIFTLQNLLIARILDKQQSPNANLQKNLVALQKVHQSLQAEKQYIGQLLAARSENKINKLIQKVDQIPLAWGSELFSEKRHQQTLLAINDEAIFTSSLIRSTKAFNTLVTETSSPLRLITRYHHLIQPYLRIAAADFHQKVQKSAEYWNKQNICHTTTNVTTAVGKSMLGLDEINSMSPVYGSSMEQMPIKNFRWEFTKGVREVKAKLKAGQPFDQVAKEFNLPSKVCPGDKWTAQAQNDTVNISFSHLPNWDILGVKGKSIVPATYKIQVKS